MSELIEPLRTDWLKTRLGISHQTVARWRRNEKVPGDRIDDVMQALRELGTQTAAAPDVSERLLAGVIALERRVGVTDADLDAARAQAKQIVDQLGI